MEAHAGFRRGPALGSEDSASRLNGSDIPAHAGGVFHCLPDQNAFVRAMPM